MHNVLRLAKVNSMSELRARANHNSRVVIPLNADMRLSQNNYDLVGSGDPVLDITRHLEAHGNPKPRSGKPDKLGRIQSGVIAIEVMVSASPSFFDRPGGSVMDRDARIERWAAVEVAALRQRWGKHLVSGHLHLDEKTPHIHAFVVPLVHKIDGRSKDKRLKWMLSARDLIGGDKSVMTREQDKHHALIAEQFPELERGKVGSEAVHKVAAVWQAEQAAQLGYAADYRISTEIENRNVWELQAAAWEAQTAAKADYQAAAAVKSAAVDDASRLRAAAATAKTSAERELADAAAVKAAAVDDASRLRAAASAEGEGDRQAAATAKTSAERELADAAAVKAAAVDDASRLRAAAATAKTSAERELAEAVACKDDMRAAGEARKEALAAVLEARKEAAHVEAASIVSRARGEAEGMMNRARDQVRAWAAVEIARVRKVLASWGQAEALVTMASARKHAARRTPKQQSVEPAVEAKVVRKAPTVDPIQQAAPAARRDDFGR